ncbi:MAG: hypothetical protein RR553_03225 [Akkermansia sp.]
MSLPEVNGNDMSMVFMRLGHVFERLREDCLKAQGEERVNTVMSMTLRQMKAVVIVSNMTMTMPQGISLKLIAERLNLTLPAASMLVEQLVKVGKFDRRINPADRREVCITLSPKGQEDFQFILHYMDDAVRELLEGFTAEDLATFTRVVNKCHAKLYTEVK